MPQRGRCLELRHALPTYNRWTTVGFELPALRRRAL